MSRVIGDRKKIHVDLPGDIHQRLRVKAALQNESIQGYVSRLISETVRDVFLPASADEGAYSAGIAARAPFQYPAVSAPDMWVSESLALFPDVSSATTVSGPLVSAREVLQAEYTQKLMVNSKLSRSLVSFQSNKNTPFYRWFRFKEAFSHEFVRYILGLAEASLGNRRRILDPFAGAGTTLTTSAREGWMATGVELLPVGVVAMRARLLADTVELDEFNREVERVLASSLNGVAKSEYKFPHIAITRHAFPPATERALGEYLGQLQDIADSKVRYLLWFAALSILEEVSYTRKDGQYLRWDSRSGRDLRSTFDKGRVLGFREAIEQKLAVIQQDLVGRNGGNLTRSVDIREGSCLQELPLIPDDSFDLVLTSPPYCNRYDYTRTYALELAFMEYGERAVTQLRQQLLSATVENKSKRRSLEAWYDSRGQNNQFQAACRIFDEHPALQEVLNLLREARTRDELNNRNIPDMVANYFFEMNLVIRELARLLSEGGTVVMVNDNVQYHGEEVPVDLILSDFAEVAGLTTQAIWVLARGKGNSSQQMGAHGRRELRKCVYVWRK